MHKDRKFVLLDTPGFDDTDRSDTDILREIANWLIISYENSVFLSGIIYMHRITDVRLGGSSLRNLRMFKKLLGEDPLPRVILVTTFWDLIPTLKDGELREQQLCQEHGFWKDMIARGSRIARSLQDRDSALSILELFLPFKSGVVLEIQRELVDQGRVLKETNAGAYLEQEIRDIERHVEQFKYEREVQGDRGHNIDPSGEASKIGNRRDLNASWNPDYGSLWLDDAANAPPKWDSEIYGSLEEGDLRLVELRAGERSLPIEVSLLVEKISDPPPYSALSYAVGNDQRQIKIKLRHKRRLYDVEVGENLHTALVHLRRANHDVTLWIDALSINQSDNTERAQQIRRMSEIFSKAANVCIWLGPATTGQVDCPVHELDLACSNDLAMKLAREVLDLRRLDMVVRDGARRADFFCLARLMASPWFTRRWCVQEVLMARRATVHCGEYVMPWVDFVDMAQLLSTKWSDIQVTIDRLTQQRVGHAHLIGALALVNTAALILRQTSTGEIVERLLTLESLLSILATFEVIVTHDAIYSIYNLARDLVGTERLRIDYALQPRELFTDVTEFIVLNSGSLNIICYPWAPVAPLPSWIPTIARLPYQRQRNGFQYYRQHGVTLVGAPGTSQRYRACGNTDARGHVTFIRRSKPVLSARGMVVGTVQEIGGQSLNGTIPSDWLRLCGWTDLQGHAAPEAFWQTIVADQGPAGGRAPGWYRRACETAVRESVTEHIDTDLLCSLSPSTHVKEYLQKVQDLIWSRALVGIKLNWNVGSSPAQTVCLCPRDTARDDLICVLYGCNVPVILRHQRDEFKMIGECFVHGIMDGEAISQMRSDGDRIFEIV